VLLIRGFRRGAERFEQYSATHCAQLTKVAALARCLHRDADHTLNRPMGKLVSYSHHLAALVTADAARPCHNKLLQESATLGSARIHLMNVAVDVRIGDFDQAVAEVRAFRRQLGHWPRLVTRINHVC
jgi:hypothetical protein